MNKCEIYNTDCIEFMKKMTKGSVNCVLTDIPYGEVSRANNGLNQMKNSDKVAEITPEDQEEMNKIFKEGVYIVIKPNDTNAKFEEYKGKS